MFNAFVKEDYYLTPDKLWIPLRWIAPELLEEFRGSLIVTDQTKTSNVWYVLELLKLSMCSAIKTGYGQFMWIMSAGH